MLTNRYGYAGMYNQFHHPDRVELIQTANKVAVPIVSAVVGLLGKLQNVILLSQ